MEEKVNALNSIPIEWHFIGNLQKNKINKLLRSEIAVRKKIEKELQDTRKQLELRVKQRTRQLAKTNLELQKKINDREGIGHTLGNLGNVANGRGDFNTAFFYYKKQIDLLTKIGDKSGAGRGLFNWGYLEFQRKNYKNSLKKFTQSLKLFQFYGETERIAVAKEWIKKVEKII